jgi:hypothetical protein
MLRNRALCAFVCASLCLAAPVAHAAPDAADQARLLAQEGGDLLDAKRYAEALERVTRAEALYHAATNVLMMAQAQEGLGHLVVALATYERLVAEPLPAGAPRPFLEAQQAGKARLRALLARVPSVLVVVHGLGAGEQADVRIDKEPYTLDAGAAKRMDPGPHVIEVTASGHPPFERSLDLPEKGGVVVVEASLAPAGAESEPAAPSPPAPPRTEMPTALLEPPARRGSLAPALVAFGVGTVALGVGAVMGAMSLSKVSDLRNRCPANRCAPEQQGEIDSTKTLGVVSTVGFAAGGAAVAVGAVLLLLRGGSAEAGGAAAQAPSITPWIGMRGAGLVGSF